MADDRLRTAAIKSVGYLARAQWQHLDLGKKRQEFLDEIKANRESATPYPLNPKKTLSFLFDTMHNAYPTNTHIDELHKQSAKMAGVDPYTKPTGDLMRLKNLFDKIRQPLYKCTCPKRKSKGPSDCIVLLLNTFLRFQGPDFVMKRLAPQYTCPIFKDLGPEQKKQLNHIQELCLRVLWCAEQFSREAVTCITAHRPPGDPSSIMTKAVHYLAKTGISRTTLAVLFDLILDQNNYPVCEQEFKRQGQFQKPQLIPLLLYSLAHSSAENTKEAMAYLTILIRPLNNIQVAIQDRRFISYWLHLLTSSSKFFYENPASIPSQSEQYKAGEDIIRLAASAVGYTISVYLQQIKNVDHSRRRLTTHNLPEPEEKEGKDAESAIDSHVRAFRFLTYTLHQIEDFCGWTQDAVTLCRVLLTSAVSRLIEAKLSRELCSDIENVIWGCIYGLLDCIENFVFYSPAIPKDGKEVKEGKEWKTRPEEERFWSGFGIHVNQYGRAADLELLQKTLDLLKGLDIEKNLQPESFNSKLKKKVNEVKKTIHNDIQFLEVAIEYFTAFSSPGADKQKPLDKLSSILAIRREVIMKRFEKLKGLSKRKLKEGLVQNITQVKTAKMDESKSKVKIILPRLVGGGALNMECHEWFSIRMIVTQLMGMFQKRKSVPADQKAVSYNPYYFTLAVKVGNKLSPLKGSTKFMQAFPKEDDKKNPQDKQPKKPVEPVFYLVHHADASRRVFRVAIPKECGGGSVAVRAPEWATSSLILALAQKPLLVRKPHFDFLRCGEEAAMLALALSISPCDDPNPISIMPDEEISDYLQTKEGATLSVLINRERAAELLNQAGKRSRKDPGVKDPAPAVKPSSSAPSSPRPSSDSPSFSSMAPPLSPPEVIEPKHHGKEEPKHHGKEEPKPHGKEEPKHIKELKSVLASKPAPSGPRFETPQRSTRPSAESPPQVPRQSSAAAAAAAIAAAVEAPSPSPQKGKEVKSPVKPASALPIAFADDDDDVPPPPAEPASVVVSPLPPPRALQQSQSQLHLPFSSSVSSVSSSPSHSPPVRTSPPPPPQSPLAFDDFDDDEDESLEHARTKQQLDLQGMFEDEAFNRTPSESLGSKQITPQVLHLLHDEESDDESPPPLPPSPPDDDREDSLSSVESSPSQKVAKEWSAMVKGQLMALKLAPQSLDDLDESDELPPPPPDDA